MTSTSTLSLAIISIDSLAAALTKLGVNVSLVTALRDTVEEEEAGKQQNQITRLLATPALNEAPNPSFFGKPYTFVRREATPEGLREEIRLLIELTNNELLHLSRLSQTISRPTA